jgi:hypothetical protein
LPATSVGDGSLIRSQSGPGARATWQIHAGSARGASHERSGSPNQDYGKAVRIGDGSGAVLSVADGHGDSLYARSDRGSHFAVDAAIDILEDWIESAFGTEDSIRVSAANLPQRILDAWRQAVANDLASHPPSRDEVAAAGHSKASLIDQTPELLYGSTLIAAAINERLAAYVQIGEGDLLAIAADGTVSRLVPGRDDLPVNQTESLCQPDAKTRFRVQVDFFSEKPRPTLLLLSTDGYCNSYTEDESFLKVGRDLKAYIEKRGFHWVGGQLEGWLKETSQAGSGDDITLALGWSGSVPNELRVPPLRKHPPRRLSAIAAVVVLLAGWAAWTWAPPSWKEKTIELVHSVRDKTLDLVHTIHD